MSFAVVKFTKEEESYSEIPTAWILEDKLHCYWPNQKNCGSLIARSVAPSKDWSLQDIEVEGYYVTLEKARRVAENPNYTSNDEGERKRNQKWSKWANYSESDEESLGESSHETRDEPPKIFKNRSYHDKVKILSVATIDGNIKTDNVDIRDDSEVSETDQGEESSGLETVQSYVIHNGYLEPIHEELQDVDKTIVHVGEDKQNEGFTNKLLDKIYKLQLENNFYLKSIYKKINHNYDSKKPGADFLNIFPFKDTDSLIEFESGITDDIKDALNSFIHKIGGKNFKDHLHRCLKSLFSNNMAKSCSWLGLRGNFKMKDTKIMRIINDVMKSAYDITDSDFEMISKEWFRLAATRMKLKKGEDN